MRISAIILVALGLALMATTTAAAAPSFSCKKAKRATEKAICQSDYLQLLDRQMALLYAYALKYPHGYSRAELQREQRAFLAERNGCGWDDACIEAAYNARNEFLETFGD